MNKNQGHKRQMNTARVGCWLKASEWRFKWKIGLCLSPRKPVCISAGIEMHVAEGQLQWAMRNGTQFSPGLKIQWLSPSSLFSLVTGTLRVHSVKSQYKVGLQWCKHKTMWRFFSIVAHKNMLLLQRFGNDEQLYKSSNDQKKKRKWQIGVNPRGLIHTCT